MIRWAKQYYCSLNFSPQHWGNQKTWRSSMVFPKCSRQVAACDPAFWHLTQWSPPTLHIETPGQPEMIVKAKLRHSFHPLISLCLLQCLSVAFLLCLPRASYSDKDAYSVIPASLLRFQASSGIISEESIWMIIRDSISFRESTLSVQSTVGICSNELKDTLGISPDAYFNLSSRSLTFQNTQFCSLWKLITGLLISH